MKLVGSPSSHESGHKIAFPQISKSQEIQILRRKGENQESDD